MQRLIDDALLGMVKLDELASDSFMEMSYVDSIQSLTDDEISEQYGEILGCIDDSDIPEEIVTNLRNYLGSVKDCYIKHLDAITEVQKANSKYLKTLRELQERGEIESISWLLA